jgi:hypothetical protein
VLLWNYDCRAISHSPTLPQSVMLDKALRESRAAQFRRLVTVGGNLPPRRMKSRAE